MDDAVQQQAGAAVYNIPQSPYAPGEVSPVVAVGVTYPSEPSSTVPIATLIARHAPALVSEEVAAADLARAKLRFEAVAPPRPLVTHYRFGDPIGWRSDMARTLPDGKPRSVYCEPHIAELRAVTDPQWFGSSDGLNGQPFAPRPDPRAARRKDEILTAWDGWIAQRTEVAVQVGWTAAQAAHNQAYHDLKLVEARILDAPTPTVADIAAKARWVQKSGKSDEYAFIILMDVLGLEDPEYRAYGDLNDDVDAEAA